MESGHPVEWAEEENYMFRLSDFRQQLLDYLDGGGGSVIQPSVYRDQLNSVLGNDLFDLSVSRSSSRLSWGIPVPGKTCLFLCTFCICSILVYCISMGAF